MLLKRLVLLAIVVMVLPSCSYKAKVLSTSAPVAEIETDKQMDCSIGYYMEQDQNSLNKDISTSTYVCSAHTYPLESEQALENSMMKVLNGCFSDVERVSEKDFLNSDNEYNFVFKLESFEPSLAFTMGFWNAAINADAEIIMKVRVYNRNGNQILRTTIAGDGSENGRGQCGDGSHFLAKATQEAIEDLLENFVYKVINSGRLIAKKE